MSVKEALLTSTADIFLLEAGISWGFSGKTPYDNWNAPDENFLLKEVDIWKPGEKNQVDSVFISNLSEEMSLRLTRKDTPDEELENEFINDYFLQPMQAFLETHEHQLCLNGLIERIYEPAKRDNVLFDREKKFPKGFRVTYR